MRLVVPRRGIAALGTAGAMVMALSACSPDSLNPFAQASPSPVPTPVDTSSPPGNEGATSAVSRLPVAQDLTLTGALNGHIDKAKTSCGGSNGSWSAALSQDLGDTPVVVYLTLVHDNGPGNYPASNGDGTINIAVHTKSVDYEGQSGGFTLASNHRSGTIDAQLTGGVHLSGTFGCAPT